MCYHGRLLVACGFLSLSAAADDIVFRNGRTVEDATVIGIANGNIRFAYGEPVQETETALANVVTMRPASASFRMVRFEDHRDGKYDGRLLEIALTEGRPRLREPVVRVFALMQDERGERELHVYINQRVKDPTSLYDMPVINANAWKSAVFFIPVKTEAVAWHIEIWQDAERLFDQDFGPKDFRKNWWLLQKPDRILTLDAPKDAAPTAAAAATPGLSAVIRAARVHRGIDQESAVFDLEWALQAEGLERVTLPEATLYYITEDADGTRKLFKKEAEPNAGDEVALKAGIARKISIALDKNINLASGTVDIDAKDDKIAGQRLIFWRFAVHSGTQELVVRESPNTTVRRSLGDDWWRN